MAWRLDTDGAAIYEPMSADDLACRDEEIAWMDLNNRPWKLVNGLIEQSGSPTALAGGFAGLEVTPGSGVIATATILTTEVAMWSVPTYTPIAANPQCPKAFILRAFGIATTAASQGTMAFNMRMGQLITSPLIGASTTAAQTASQTTTNWHLQGDVLIRRGGAATNGAAVGMFMYNQGTATTGGSAILPAISQVFGSTAEVAVQTDAALANGLWPGAIAVTSTTNTFVPLGIIWASWN
jgi:hypothetical protein